MCLYIKNPNYNSKSGRPVPLIATEHITCYKVFTSEMKSKVRKTKYKVGKLYTVKVMGTTPHVHLVERGLHSYRTLHKAQRSKVWYDNIIAECRIPKGSRYFIGKGSELVSDRLVVKKKLTKPKK